jgi:hypothetical protein
VTPREHADVRKELLTLSPTIRSQRLILTITPGAIPLQTTTSARL